MSSTRAPIFDARHDDPVAAVAISMLSAQLTNETAAAIAAVTTVAATLARQLGGRRIERD